MAFYKNTLFFTFDSDYWSESYHEGIGHFFFWKRHSGLLIEESIEKRKASNKNSSGHFWCDIVGNRCAVRELSRNEMLEEFCHKEIKDPDPNKIYWIGDYPRIWEKIEQIEGMKRL